MNTRKNKKLTITSDEAKWYGLLISLIPILATYNSPIPGVDLGTFVAVIYSAIYLIIKRPPLKEEPLLLVILFYSFASGLLAYFLSIKLYSEATTVLMRTCRFVLMIVLVVLAAGNQFDTDKTMRVVGYFAVFVAAYAIIQMIFYNITGLKLINVIGNTKQEVVFSEYLGKYEETYRPPSIFLEPSSVIYYLVPYLVYLLFRKNNLKLSFREIVAAVLISAGILCTTSGQGILVGMLIWVIWIIKYILTNVRKGSTLFVVIFVLLIAMLVYRSNMLSYGMERVFFNDNTSAVDARILGYYSYLKLSTLWKIIGVGFGNYYENIYYSSFADILFCTGIIGLILVVIFYLKIFIRGETYKKVLVVASFGLMLGGGIYTATYLCLYLPILLFTKKTGMRSTET